MNEAGIYTTDGCLRYIVDNFDNDGNGKISAEEFGNCTAGIHPKSLHERNRYIAWETFKYAPMYLAFFNLAASILAAKTNIRERENGDLFGADHIYWELAAISDLIGNFGYVCLEIDAQLEAYENWQLVIQKFLTWLKSDLPRQLRKEESLKMPSRRTSSFGIVEDPLEEHEEIEEHEEKDVCNSKDEQANELSNRQGGVSNTTKKQLSGEELIRTMSKRFNIDTNQALHFDNFRLLLEKSNLYMSDKAFRKLFREIDKDGSGAVTLDELCDFSFEKEQEMMRHESLGELAKQKFVLRKCLRSLGMYASCLYTIGAVFWITFSFTGLYNMLRLTVLCYLSAAVFSMYFLFHSTSASLEQVEYADSVLRETAILCSHHKDLEKYIAITNEEYQNDETTEVHNENTALELSTTSMLSSSTRENALVPEEISSATRDITVGTRECDNGEIPDDANVEMILDNQDEEINFFDTPPPSTVDKEDNTTHKRSSMRESALMRDAVLSNFREVVYICLRTNFREIVHSYSRHSNPSQGSVAFREPSVKKRSFLGRQKRLSTIETEKQAEGARALFTITDIDKSASLTEAELFSALSTLGVLVPTNSFSIIFKRIDKSRDGLIQLEEFVEYISEIKKSVSVIDRLSILLSTMSKKLSFYLILVKIIAGSCQTTASFASGLPSVARANLFLAGSIGWAIGSIYLMIAFPASKGRQFDLIERTMLSFKDSIMKDSQDYFMSPSSER